MGLRLFDLGDEGSITDAILTRLSQSSSESLHKIKFGSGAVGKITLAAVFAFLAIGASAFKMGASGAVVGVIAIVLIFLAMLAAIIYIVQKQPELAVLEGMELVRYKQITIGAKDFKPEKELPPVPDPKIPRIEGES
jgi:hypothetical protein